MPRVEPVNVPNLQLDAAVNILFLGDGFTAEEQGYFNELTDYFSENFHNVPPFCIDSFRNKINFFRAFTPSPYSGAYFDGFVDQFGIPVPANHPYEKYKLKRKDHPAVFNVPLDPDPSTELLVQITSDVHDRINAVIDNLTYVNPLTPNSDDELIPIIWRKLPETGILPPLPSGQTEYTPSQVQNYGKDHNAVIVLINENIGRAGSKGYSFLPLHTHSRFNLTSKDNRTHVADHVPLRVTQDTQRLDLLHTLVHEFGHSYFYLYDEYAEEETGTIGNEICLRNYANGVFVFPHGVGNDLDENMIPWKNSKYPKNSTGIPEVLLPEVLQLMKDNKAPLFNTETESVNGQVHIKSLSGGATKPNHPAFDEWIRAKKDAKIVITHPEEIIGLYEQSRGFFFNLYRPAGACKMRQHFNRAKMRGTDFCSACMHIVTQKLAEALNVDVDKALSEILTYDYAYRAGLRELPQPQPDDEERPDT